MYWILGRLIHIANTEPGKAVKLLTLENDKVGNLGRKLNPASVSIVNPPVNGTATVDTLGNIIFQPNPGFIGVEVYTYKVCDDNNPPLCDTATQEVKVIMPRMSGAPVVNGTQAADDYANTLENLAVSGNVKMNDTDAEGDIQTIVAQNTTLAGVGTLVLNATGAYTFTPEPGFRGPVNFKYTVCDNGTPSACAEATLYILVGPFDPDPDVFETPWRVRLTASIVGNDTVPAGTTYGTPIPLAGNPPLSTITMLPNGTFDFMNRRVGTYQYNVPVCPAGH